MEETKPLTKDELIKFSKLVALEYGDTEEEAEEFAKQMAEDFLWKEEMKKEERVYMDYSNLQEKYDTGKFVLEYKPEDLEQWILTADRSVMFLSTDGWDVRLVEKDA